MKVLIPAILAFSVISTQVYAKSGSAIPHVKTAAKHYNVPLDIAIKVCMVESRCNCNVRRGAAGEIGPMQVLPRTARGIGMSLKGCKNQVFAGMKYLKMALRTGGVWKYNQGIHAKRKSRMAAKYERLVHGKKIPNMNKVKKKVNKNIIRDDDRYSP